MFRNVNRRLLRTLVYVLVTAQVLSFAPVAAAGVPEESSASTQMPCAATMADTMADTTADKGDSKSCPCCPDGTKGVAACLSTCTASVGAIAALVIPVANTSSGPIRVAFSTARADLPDPPLKPPPIV